MNLHRLRAYDQNIVFATFAVAQPEIIEEIDLIIITFKIKYFLPSFFGGKKINPLSATQI